MKEARKAPAAQAPVASRSRTAAARDAGAWLRTTIILVALFCAQGVIPAALGGQVLGYWRVPVGTSPLSLIPGYVAYDAPLGKPQPFVTNAVAPIVQAPGASSPMATLQPGFPVSVTRYATRGSVRWAQIHWGGPTKAAGGSGWTLGAQLQAPAAGGARPIGDLAALAPRVGQAAASLGSGFSATLYFPAGGYAYHSDNVTQPVAIGSQVIPVILVALYAEGKLAGQSASTGGVPAIAHDLAYGNSQALVFDYNLVGGAAGMSQFLANHNITGFQFVASQPMQTTATPQALSLFWTALASGQLVGASDQQRILTLLADANQQQASAYAPAAMLGSGALVESSTPAAKEVAQIVTGELIPAKGPAVIIVAIATTPSADSGQTALKSFTGQVIAIMQG